MEHRLLRNSFTVVLVLVSLLSLACARHRVLRYDDLVTDNAHFASKDPRAEAFCADQTRYVRPLGNKGEIRAPLEIGEQAKLELTFCRPGHGKGKVSLNIAAGSEHPVAESFPISGAPEWIHREIDLGKLAGDKAKIVLTASLPDHEKVLFRAAYVREWSRDAAGWPRPGVHVLWQETHPGKVEGPLLKQSAMAPPAPGKAPPPSGKLRKSPQILLISIDTLRADMLAPNSPYTPNLTHLAADGEVFTPHHPGASWTKPSHATLLTGYPLSVTQADTDDRVINPAAPTLAERLRDAGLATGGLVHDCVWLNPKFGFARGFEDYRSVKWGLGQEERGAVNWIAAHRHHAFFFFLHTFDVHSDFYHLPYESDTTSAATVRKRFGVKGYGCRDGKCASALLEALGKKEVEPLPDEGRILRYLYTAGVREVDAELGQLFADLKAMGLYKKMLIVVTADHGEMLLEHGATLHGVWWNPVITVPLIVKWPDNQEAGRRITIPTSSIDVATTLLAAAGVKKTDLPGLDLHKPRSHRPIFVGSIAWWAVYDGPWKAVFSPKGGDHLFNLAEDPNELHDMGGTRPGVEGRLHHQLEVMLSWSRAERKKLAAGGRGKATTTLSPQERKRLKALGYLQ